MMPNFARPWLPEEYMVVNGFPLVYTTSRADGMLVRLPGRRQATPDELISAGYDVRFPRSVRNEYKEQS
jgi:hypothetical protein